MCFWYESQQLPGQGRQHVFLRESGLFRSGGFQPGKGHQDEPKLHSKEMQEQEVSRQMHEEQ